MPNDSNEYTIPADAYAIIIGSMKSGTSSLYAQLEQSQEVCGCYRKEPEFFSTKNAEYNRAEYQKLWNFNNQVHKIALEASTGYTKSLAGNNVPEKILNSGINPKFIYMVRDPIERIVSHYFHNRSNESSMGTLKDNLEYYVNVSNYFLQLQNYAKIFSKKSILVIDFAEYKSNSQAVLDQCCEFLGLDSIEYKKAEMAGTENRGHYYSDLRASMDDNNGLNKIISLIPANVKLKLKQVFPKQFGDSYQLETKIEDKIRAMLNKDMQSLRKEYNINISDWGFD
jgi:hypothetical protein